MTKIQLVNRRSSDLAFRTVAPALVALCVACGGTEPGGQGGTPDGGAAMVVEGACEIANADADTGLAGADAGVTTTPTSLRRIGCRADFLALSSEPLDTSLPGARSVKVVFDRLGGDALYFQNSKTYQIHYQFASAQLSGRGLPLVPSLAEFNQTEYFSPDRRFILGAVTYYEGPNIWALEVAPYDTASNAMIATLHAAIAKAAFFGPALAFHPTSQVLETQAKTLPVGIPVKSTDDIYAATDYQPLNLASTIGKLRFVKAEELTTTYLAFRDIVVLDRVPNDISVVLGLVTEEFQTPLSHLNVLSLNRKTPNMGLRGAMSNPILRALEGKWVRLTVGAFAWTATEVTAADADAFWEGKKPTPVTLPAVDETVRDLRDIEAVVDESSGSLRSSIKNAILAFGGKAAHYSILARTKDVPARKAFAVPAYYYLQFMRDNGLFEKFDQMAADPAFREQASVRDAKLLELRTAIAAAPVNPDFQALLKAKMDADYPGLSMRFRTSTNSEDLDGFPCAGCYESHTGDAADWDDVLDAVRETWASIWLFRTFEERAYHSIDHKSVVMALLVHNNFPAEEANGVAVTANPFDPSGLQPGFFVNVQYGGDAEVVHPPPGITSDQFIYQYNQTGKPITYLAHSNLVPDDQTVLSSAQVFELGKAMDAIHQRFSPAYGPAAGNNGWYAMDIEFKFDGAPGEVPKLYVKQARPYPGRTTE